MIRPRHGGFLEEIENVSHQFREMLRKYWLMKMENIDHPTTQVLEKNLPVM